VDFADVRTIMANTGDALMGIGSARGENRALEAAQSAIASPLLDGISIEGARGLLINITADPSLTMQEVSDAISQFHPNSCLSSSGFLSPTANPPNTTAR